MPNQVRQLRGTLSDIGHGKGIQKITICPDCKYSLKNEDGMVTGCNAAIDFRNSLKHGPEYFQGYRPHLVRICDYIIQKPCRMTQFINRTAIIDIVGELIYDFFGVPRPK